MLNVTGRLGDIVIDPHYQVRMKVDSQKVSEYTQAMQLGHIFPPMVIEESTKKVVCGFTRIEAYTRVFSPDKYVSVMYKTFRDSLKRQLFAVRDNSTHGQPLNTWDKRNIVCKLCKEGASVEIISGVLACSVNWVEEQAGVLVAEVGGKKSKKKGSAKESVKSEQEIIPEPPFVVVDGEHKPLKGGLKHLEGKVISRKVYTNIVEHHNGWSDAFLIGQLTMRLVDGIFDTGNKETVQAMQRLCKLFGKTKKALKPKK